MTAKEIDTLETLLTDTIEDLRDVDALTKAVDNLYSTAVIAQQYERNASIIDAKPMVSTADRYVAAEHVRFTHEAPHIEAATHHMDMETTQIAASFHNVLVYRSIEAGVSLDD